MDDRPEDMDDEASYSRTISKIISWLKMPTKEVKQPPNSKGTKTYETELLNVVKKFDVTSEQGILESRLVLQSSEDKTPESRDMTLGTRFGIKRNLSEGPAKDSGAKRQIGLDLASYAKSQDNQRSLADSNCSERATIDYSSLYKYDCRFYATPLPSASLSSSFGMLPEEENTPLDLPYISRDGISVEVSTSTGVSGNSGCESSQDYSTNRNERTTVDYSSSDKKSSAFYDRTLPLTSLYSSIRIFPNEVIEDVPDCSVINRVDYNCPKPLDKNTSRFFGTTLPSASLSSSISMFPNERNFRTDYINTKTLTSDGVSGSSDFSSSQVTSSNRNRELLYECARCSETFLTEVNFMNHLFIHGKPYICKFCKRKFIKLPDFINHYRFHEE